jgi:nucleoside-diphosphate-sugar epimerase
MNRDAICGNRLVNQVHRDDIASAILFLARSRDVNPPRIFNVVDDTPAPRTEILQWLSSRLGLPLSDSPSSAPTKGRGSNKRVSNAKLRALGWAPAYPNYREGFERSVLPAFETSGA